jgi:hypothetical protein
MDNRALSSYIFEREDILCPADLINGKELVESSSAEMRFDRKNLFK